MSALARKCCRAPAVARVPGARDRRWLCAAAVPSGRRTVEIRIPPRIVENMPAVAEADLSVLSLPHLTWHLREAAARWQIQYPQYWRVALARLRTLSGEFRLVDATRLLVIFSRMRLVDLELVDLCERIVVEAEGDTLLDLRLNDLAQLAVALARMRRPDGLDAVLRPLTSRAHRLEPGVALRLLRAASDVDCVGAGEFLHATARGAVERGGERPETLAALCAAAAALAEQGRCDAGPRSGAALLFRHAARRAKEQPADFAPLIAGIAEAARSAGCPQPGLAEAPQEE